MSKENSSSPSAKRPRLPDFGQAVCRWPGSPQVKQRRAAGLEDEAFMGAGEVETVVRVAGCVVPGRLVVVGIAAVAVGGRRLVELLELENEGLT